MRSATRINPGPIDTFFKHKWDDYSLYVLFANVFVPGQKLSLMAGNKLTANRNLWMALL